MGRIYTHEQKLQMDNNAISSSPGWWSTQTMKPLSTFSQCGHDDMVFGHDQATLVTKSVHDCAFQGILSRFSRPCFFSGQ